MQVVLVPATPGSGELLEGGYVGLPQPALSRRSLKLPTGVITVGNPAQMEVGQVRIALTSVDVLLHLSSEELVLGALTDVDRLARLAGHLLTQRR